ncbi:MAG: alpha/beta hydrolase [bacterium]
MHASRRAPDVRCFALLLALFSAPAIAIAAPVCQTVNYAVTTTEPLALDIYRPPVKPSGRIVLFFHAGGFIQGTRKSPGPDQILETLLNQGDVIVSADYRLVPHGVFPNNLHDCRDALRWCQSHAADYGADPAKVIVMGASAGAYLATFTASAPADKRWDTHPERFRKPLAVVAYYGVFDFRIAKLPTWPGWVQTMLKDDANRKAASPAAWISKDDPPVFLMVGLNDHMTPMLWSHDYDAALRAAGVQSTLVVVGGLEHGFVDPPTNPQQDGAWRRQQVVDWLSQFP